MVLEIQNVTKVYKSKMGELRAVDGASFSVSAGEVVGFVGPNGAGKSTLIKMITGLTTPTSGNISVCGHDTQSARPEALKCIGAVVENPDHYMNWTALENMKYVADLSCESLTKDQKAAKIEELLRLMGIFDRAIDKVSKFSLGMKQRLGIAEALISDPKLLILDEPANGLDPSGIKEIREILIRLAHEFNMAVLVSSHQLSELQQTCDRFIIINKGKIVATPSKNELNAGTGKTVITVDDVLMAIDILRSDLGITASLAGEKRIEIPIDVELSAVSKALILNGVNIINIEKKQANLEELYMSLTVKKAIELENSGNPETTEEVGE